MTKDTLRVGKFFIRGLRDGFFYLDGGAMFGVVPKVLWEKAYPADEQNRIKLGLNSLLIETREARILVETGIGTLLDPKYFTYYSVDRNPGLFEALKRLGIEADKIDFIINTHLHFDHCGGNTLRSEKGNLIPAFPKAKYIIQKSEWECALNPSPRDKPSYLKETFLSLKEQGKLKLVDGDQEVIPGVKVVLAPGHTSSHQCVKVESEGKILFFLGDMVPTSAHVRLPYIMSYDLYPQETLESKEKVFEQAIAEDWVVAFVHDPEHYFGKIRKQESKYIFEPL